MSIDSGHFEGSEKHEGVSGTGGSYADEEFTEYASQSGKLRSHETEFASEDTSLKHPIHH